jgi:acetyl esterase/lipase
LSFNPTLDAFSESTLANMDGVASINYRLSAYPDHSTNPSADDDPSRNAKHPDHLEDVTTTLLFLQRQYGIDGRYVLVGHSCGATLALQVPATFKRQVVPRPAAIIGSEGIYDIPNLVKVHTHPAYRQFVVSAFGDEESVWRKVSPCYMDPGLWLTSKEVVISHSLEDELVGQDQAEAMLNCLRSTKTWQGQARFVTVEGAHDSIWSEGHAMAQLIESALAGIHIFA